MAPNSFEVSDPAFANVLAKLRDRSLRPAAVRSVVAELTSILAKDAVTPVAPGEKIAVIIILRSGLAMMDSFVAALPAETDMVIYHLGLFRERQTLQPIEYYNKLPQKDPRIKHAYVLDPLVATGGTAGASISILRDWGVDQITFLCLLASQAGLETAANVWPESTRFVVGAVDPELDDKGYVKPGVGDIGDRLFGTALN
ncbi:uracil phosphoribosyltransferase-domain-containing protein [Hypoxylon cercidicola]|nr:uracil phosphoribosyltransferase-domain-containing protein [Hypoxylon cercidicola]